MPKTDVAIEVSDLTKHYGETVAVDHLTFTVEPGRVTGFLGPNGAGKSTAMRLILGLDRPDEGAATIGATPYQELAEPLDTVGALLEARAVHPGRSAYHHLLWMAQTQGISRRRVHEVLDLVGLTEVARKRAGTFSLGMGQRLGIAVALLGDPAVLVLDEPVNGLDPEGVLWIRTLLKQLAAEGRTVFLSSHLMNEMAVTADDLVVIGRGRLIAACSTQDFIRRGAEVVKVRTGDPDQLSTVLESEGGRVAWTDDALLVSELPAPRIAELAAAHRLVIYELSPQLASLEQVFMEATHDSVEYDATRMERKTP